MKMHVSFKILKTVFVICVFACSILQAFGQMQTDALFSIQTPLDVAITMSIREVQKSKEDSSWLSHKLYYKNASGLNDSIKVDLKGRGNFRLRECYIPPLWIKIKKSESKGTLFEGNKKVKLVLPCNNQNGSNDLILREYICYKLYEVVSPYAFKTRLVNADLTELRGKKNKNFQLKGILIEDINKTAKRFNAKPLEDETISAPVLEDTNALRLYLFQFLISNTDWSEIHQHNTKLIYQHNGNYISIPYDFDMSGLVDAPYAVVSMIGDTPLPVESVRQRYYRGFCRSPEVTQFVRNEFLSKEEKLLSIPDLLKGELNDKEIAGIKEYLEEFFDVLKNDNLFKRNILDNCRSAY
jgi:hypothetical protein